MSPLALAATQPSQGVTPPSEDPSILNIQVHSATHHIIRTKILYRVCGMCAKQMRILCLKAHINTEKST